ncbi:MAG: hypothetical protein WAW41_20840 [Methylobacter sp.]
MQIELVGCTCAGKTTLAKKMIAAGQALGIDVQLSDDFLLNCLRLNWIKQEFVRRRVIELWALLTCPMFLYKYRELYDLIIRICFLAPGSVPYRIKLARVALKKIGIYEIIRRRSSDQQVILLDNEGVLQASHTLFVHTGSAPYADNLADFLNLAPLPDVIAYLRLPEPLLIERTLKRGHNRIPENSETEAVANFISQAVFIFDEIQHDRKFADKLIVIDGERNKISSGEHALNPGVAKVAKLILAGMNTTPTNGLLPPSV